jgi:hypothetical protein
VNGGLWMEDGDERKDELATRELELSLWALTGTGWVIP